MIGGGSVDLTPGLRATPLPSRGRGWGERLSAFQRSLAIDIETLILQCARTRRPLQHGRGACDMALVRPLVRRPIMPDQPSVWSVRSGFTLAPQNKQPRHVIISPGAHEQQNRLKRLAKRRK